MAFLVFNNEHDLVAVDRSRGVSTDSAGNGELHVVVNLEPDKQEAAIAIRTDDGDVHRSGAGGTQVGSEGRIGGAGFTDDLAYTHASADGVGGVEEDAVDQEDHDRRDGHGHHQFNDGKGASSVGVMGMGHGFTALVSVRMR